MRRLPYRALAAPLIAVLLLGTTGCVTGDSRADEPDPEAEEQQAAEGEGAASDEPEKEAVPVEVIPLGRGEIESILSFSTTLEAEREVEVYSETARRVVELLVEEGSEVDKGDLLIKLQDEEQRTALAKAKAQYDKAKREYDRQERLFAQDLISEQAMNEATYEVERLALEVEEAERALSYTEVRAPISGTVTRRLVNVGDYVTPNQHLFDLVDFDSIVARVYVPEKELSRLAVGLPARVSSPALEEERYRGAVERIAPVVDPKSGTVKVTVSLPRARGLRPGMYVEVDLVAATRADALLVPKRALVYDDDQIFVFRIGEEGQAERVLLTAALEDEEFIEPAGGLAEGDRIVIAGQAGLKDGSRVRIAATRGAGGEVQQAAGR